MSPVGCLGSLLQAGASPFAKNGVKQTPLEAAADRGSTAAVRTLLEHMSTEAAIAIGRAAGMAALCGHPECIAAIMTAPI